MNSCLSCSYYDRSVDACNADDKCFTEGVEHGKQYMIDELKKFVDKKLDMHFALDILCKQVIDDFIRSKENE